MNHAACMQIDKYEQAETSKLSTLCVQAFAITAEVLLLMKNPDLKCAPRWLVEAIIGPYASREKHDVVRPPSFLRMGGCSEVDAVFEIPVRDLSKNRFPSLSESNLSASNICCSTLDIPSLPVPTPRPRRFINRSKARPLLL
jgi:hypothetical protein